MKYSNYIITIRLSERSKTLRFVISKKYIDSTIRNLMLDKLSITNYRRIKWQLEEDVKNKILNITIRKNDFLDAQINYG